MNSAHTILSETKAISPAVANLPKINPFTLPAGYFETSLTQIKELVQKESAEDEKQIENAILPVLDRTNAFALPNEYFNNFSNTLLAKVRSSQSVSDELNEIAPILIPTRAENPFYVPNGYFSSNSFELPSKKSGITPVFQMRSLLRYAAAACIVGLAFFSYIQVKVDSSKRGIVHKLNSQQTEELSIADMSVYLEQMDSIGHDNDADFSNGDESNLLVDLDKETILEILREIPDKGITAFIEEEEFQTDQSLN
jgi:hypothetical protein